MHGFVNVNVVLYVQTTGVYQHFFFKSGNVVHPDIYLHCDIKLYCNIRFFKNNNYIIILSHVTVLFEILKSFQCKRRDFVRTLVPCN